MKYFVIVPDSEGPRREFKITWYQNKAVVYDLLFRTAAETLLTIAADPKHLGAPPTDRRDG